MPVQNEYALMLIKSTPKTSAKLFLDFLETDEAQKIILTKNYMLPLNKNVVKGTEFEKLEMPKFYEFSNKYKRKDVLNFWKKISW